MYKILDKIVDGYFCATDTISAHPHIALWGAILAIIAVL